MTASEGPLVTTVDLRKARYCVDGFRAWMAHYGLDIREFISHGLPAEQFTKTGDAQGLRLVSIAESRVANGQK